MRRRFRATLDAVGQATRVGDPDVEVVTVHRARSEPRGWRGGAEAVVTSGLPFNGDGLDGKVAAHFAESQRAFPAGGLVKLPRIFLG